MEDTTESISVLPPPIDPSLMSMDLSFLDTFSISPVPNSAQDETLSYEELLLSHNALKESHQKLLSEKAEMQTKIEYWTKLYTYVERGITMKISELTTVKEENTELKNQIGKLIKRVEQSVNSRNTELLTKRIQLLEDQVRARNLVIELMKKAEKEKVEKETQEKLDLQRQQLEEQLGLAIGSTKANPNQTVPLSVWAVPPIPSENIVSRSRVNLRPKPGGVSSHVRPNTRSQAGKSTRRVKQKQAKEKDRTDDGGDAQMETGERNTENGAEAVVIEPINRGGQKGDTTTIAEHEVGTEVDKTMEELFGPEELDD